MVRQVRTQAGIEAQLWAPQAGPQEAFVTCPAFEAIYGGARGGGKTDAALGDFAGHAQWYGKAAQGLFVRRTRVALEPTIERAKAIFRPLEARWEAQRSRFTWPSGAMLYFRYIDSDEDAENYQGHSYTRVYVEEMTQFATPRAIDRLKATLRSAEGVATAFRATCNPGGPGHAWVKARYIDPGELQRVSERFEDPMGGEAVELTRVFIAARLADNPRLLANDPKYVARLRQSGSADLVRAWLDGDWNVVEGAFFDVWSNRNIVFPFEIPAHWTRIRSFDWGSARPFSVGWWAVVSDDHVAGHVVLPRGALVRYREWYGSLGQAPDMFSAFLNAYERGRDLARQRHQESARGTFAEASPNGDAPWPPGLAPFHELPHALPDDESFHRVAGAAHVLSALGHGMMGRPPEERRQIIDHAKSDLMKLGLGERQIDAFHPSDDNLRTVIARLRPLIEMHRNLHPRVFGSSSEPGGSAD